MAHPHSSNYHPKDSFSIGLLPVCLYSEEGSLHFTCSTNTHLRGLSLTRQLPYGRFIPCWATASLSVLRGGKPPLERYHPNTYLQILKAHFQFGNNPWLSNRLPDSVADGSQSPHTTPYVCMFREGKPLLENSNTNIRQSSSTSRLKSSLHSEISVSRPSSTPQLSLHFTRRLSSARSEMEVPSGGCNANITFLSSKNRASKGVSSFHNTSQARYKQLVHFHCKITYNYISLCHYN